ncbi:hypothetical protein [Delftia acidovorans]
MDETTHLTHRFTRGLRFDGLWTYSALMPSGRAYWARLPPTRAGGVAAADPQRAWWCVRQCVAVLNRRPWRSAHLPSGLPAQPECGDVALALGAMLADWNVKVLDEPSTQAPLLRSTDALLAGGCSLLQLQTEDSSDGVQAVFWAWVIGVEMHERFQRAKRISAFDMPGRPGALLIWPFGSPLAWNHALRVTVDGEGLCDVDGLDARASRYRCTAAITLEPLSNDIAINGSFS